MENVKEQVEKLLPEIDFAKKNYQVLFNTSMGDILLDLYPEKAPGHAKNIIALTQCGFYNGVIFHRVIPGFVIQAGCPNGTGAGGPGYTVRAEFNELLHEAGVLSMARTNEPHSAGSQFFLCLGRVSHLDRQYTVFGKTANPESLDVVLKIGAVATGHGDKPQKDVVIQTATVIESQK